MTTNPYYTSEELHNYRFLEEQIKRIETTDEIYMSQSIGKKMQRIRDDLLQKYPDIESINFHEHSDKYFILRHVKELDPRIDPQSLIDSAYDDLSAGKYRECIKKLEAAQAMKKDFSSYTASIIGKCLKQLGYTETAARFYILANNVNYMHENPRRYDMEIEECRKGIKTGKKIFNPSFDYLKKEVKELLIVDIVDSNEPIEETFDMYNLNSTEKIYAKLYLAMEYFHRDLPKMGDKLIKQVEQTENKSDTVRAFLEYVKSNKKMFKNNFIK